MGPGRWYPAHMILSVAGVSRQFGIDIVLENVSFRLEGGEKTALIGRNGAGKTTLLRLITGQDEPDRGSVQLRRGAKVGYLRQEHPVTPGITLLEEAEGALAAKLEMKRRLDELEARLQSQPDPDDQEEYAALLEHLSETDAYSAERDVRTVLRRMGFTEDEFNKRTDDLSGGEKTRLAIARLLLEEPDLLILDEPTNHLDMNAVEWLEGWLRAYHGAVLLVSHDRAFLEATVGRVLELRQHTIKSYPGDYRQYLRLRAEDEARQAEAAARQAQQIAKLDEYVRRFMNSQRTAQARGRQKLMNRMIANRIEAPTRDKGMTAGFKEIKRSGDLVMEAVGLRVGYPGVTLIESLDWQAKFGERWGIIGENGAGKSTLIKTLLGQLEAQGGRSRLGSNVELGYFSQDTAVLDPEDSPLEFIMSECSLEPGPARDLLGRFLFHGDDVFRPIRTLSGGEKNKLVLAALTFASPNLLILDEPTNHLDMDSREALGEVLREYPGTLILISHDRWLLGQVTTHTLDIRRSGPVQYSGSYPECREWRTRQDRPGVAPLVARGSARPVAEAPSLSPRELSKEIARMRGVVAASEQEIERLEGQLAHVERQLSDPESAGDVVALSVRHGELQAEVQRAMEQWEAHSRRLDELSAMQG